MTIRCLIYAFILVIIPPDCSGLCGQTLDDFFTALSAVESGHDDNAVGDGGASIGRYQIQWAYWKDAIDHDPSIGGKYEDVKDPAYARRIMLAYWDRYARKALAERDFETLARIHNGGPRGASKDATIPYWRKVERQLTQ